MPTAIHQQVRDCQSGQFARAVCKLKSGWVILGHPQIVPGYCLLLPDPVVPHLNALSRAARALFLYEMTAVGDAILELTNALRINYEMLGNIEPALHAHLFPRYAEEAEDVRTAPIWLHDWGAAPAFREKQDASFMESLHEKLDQAGLVC